MRYLLMTGLILLAGCCSTKEITERTRRDSVLVFQPRPITDTVYLPGAPTGILNPNCDTLAILERYGNVDAEKIDSAYYWRVKWNSVTRKLSLLERREPVIKTVAVETLFKQTMVQKISFIQILGYMALGAISLVGILIALKGIKL